MAPVASHSSARPPRSTPSRALLVAILLAWLPLGTFGVGAVGAGPLRVAHAAPPGVLGTIDVRPALVAAPPELPSLPPLAYEPCSLGALPEEARPLEQRRRALGASYARFEAEMRARGLSPEHRGPTVDDMLREAAVIRGRLAETLAAEARALSPEAWALLGEVRRIDSEADPLGRPLAPHVAQERVREARAAFEWAARAQGTAAATFARVRLAELAARAGEREAAEAHLEAAATTGSGEAQRHALVLLAVARREARWAERALQSGATGLLASRARLAIAIAARHTDPERAVALAAALASEGDPGAAATVDQTLADLLLRVGDPRGERLTAASSGGPALTPARRARVLAQVAERALALGEKTWAVAALQASGEALEAAGAREDAERARARAEALEAELRSAPPEPVAAWLRRQAARCLAEARAVDAGTAGEVEVRVWRVRGRLRVNARAGRNPRPGLQTVERCLEGALPDPPGLDATTRHAGSLRLASR